jgi:hypothetical protein
VLKAARAILAGGRQINGDFQRFLPILRDTTSTSKLEIGDIHLSDCFVVEKRYFLRADFSGIGEISFCPITGLWPVMTSGVPVTQAELATATPLHL